MSTETITLNIPEALYRRLVSTAQATLRPLEEVILHTLQVGSPPPWDDVPPEFQAELAALDRLDDAALWGVLRGHKGTVEMARYDDLLELNQKGPLADAERLELLALRTASERFMLRKAQAAVLLRWRGHNVPVP